MRKKQQRLEELECYFIRAIVDDYQQSWDALRRQKRNGLWEEAVRQTGVPQSPDDLKLLLMKAQNRKVRNHTYPVHDRSRISWSSGTGMSVQACSIDSPVGNVRSITTGGIFALSICL